MLSVVLKINSASLILGSTIEYGVASVPGGVFLVLGFELLDAHCHFTDNTYKSFDSSYQ